jgi:hypothetical protein
MVQKNLVSLLSDYFFKERSGIHLLCLTSNTPHAITQNVVPKWRDFTKGKLYFRTMCLDVY